MHQARGWVKTRDPSCHWQSTAWPGPASRGRTPQDQQGRASSGANRPPNTARGGGPIPSQGSSVGAGIWACQQGQCQSGRVQSRASPARVQLTLPGCSGQYGHPSWAGAAAPRAAGRDPGALAAAHSMGTPRSPPRSHTHWGKQLGVGAFRDIQAKGALLPGRLFPWFPAAPPGTAPLPAPGQAPEGAGQHLPSSHPCSRTILVITESSAQRQRQASPPTKPGHPRLGGCPGSPTEHARPGELLPLCPWLSLALPAPRPSPEQNLFRAFSLPQNQWDSHYNSHASRGWRVQPSPGARRARGCTPPRDRPCPTTASMPGPGWMGKVLGRAPPAGRAREPRHPVPCCTHWTTLPPQLPPAGSGRDGNRGPRPAAGGRASPTALGVRARCPPMGREAGLMLRQPGPRETLEGRSPLVATATAWRPPAIIQACSELGCTVLPLAASPVGPV